MHTSIKQISGLLKQEGTSRQERYNTELHETGALMDDRNMQDMIAWMQRYSKNVLFVNTDDNPIDLKKSWEHFFKNDILFLIANVATKNVSEIRDVFEFLFNKFEADRTVENFTEVVEFVFTRLQKIDGWFKQSQPDKLLNMDFTLYIRAYLHKELATVREMLLYGYSQSDNRKKIDTLRKDLQELDPIWEATGQDNIALRERMFDGSDSTEKLLNASVLLHAGFDTVFHAIEAIVERCSGYFKEAVKERQQFHHDHNPHVALIIAFIKLFDYARDEINKIPKRHLDFYYKDVLQIKEKPAVPDNTFVVFELAKGFEVADIKKGTKLSAGKDKKNRELVFETEKDIIINKARVKALRTILIERNTNREILNYYRNDIQVGWGLAPSPDPATNNLQRIFGEQNHAAIAEVGFAIASSQLYLAKGERNVTVIFESPVKIEPCSMPETTGGPVIFDTSIIKLLLTAEKGWINSDNPGSEINIESLTTIGENNLELKFSISIKLDQAIIAFDKNLHEGNFDTLLPVMQCILKYPPPVQNEEDLNPDLAKSRIDQLCTLQRIKVSKVNVNVQVGMKVTNLPAFDGIRDLVLENDESVVDPKKPFFPFTAVPKVGSSFYIGHKDLFYKKINELSFNLEWILPDNFETHYHNYLPPYDAGRYTATLSYLEDKKWIKLRDTAIIEGPHHNQKFRSIKLEFKKDKEAAAAAKPEAGIPTFDQSKKNGTFRLKLNYPDFGHTVYPQLITSIVMEKAASKSSEVDYYEIVKHHLRDSQFSIKLESDIADKNGSLAGVYQVIDSKLDNAAAKKKIIQALSGILSSYNTGSIVFKPQTGTPSPSAGTGRMIINDDSFAERFLGFLRNIKLVSRDVHIDENKQGVQEVTDSLKARITKRANIMLPSDQELMNLIMNETNAAINKTVVNVTDGIVSLRVKGQVDPNQVAELLKSEVEEVNEVINDMIAKKIALHLSANEIPPPPYSPLLKTISVSYSSDKELSVKDNDKLFRVTPMGVIETSIIGPVSAEASNPLSPKNNIFPASLIEVDSIEFQGMLFIGVAELVPNQNLSLLIQFAEGSRKSDKKPPMVRWFYRRATDWKLLEDDHIVSDSTFGYQATGIIELSFPSDAQNNGTLFDHASLYWICAAVEKDAESFPYIIDVMSQAVTAVFKDDMNDPKRLALPLEAHKIKTAVDDLPGIKKIAQPVPSYNGKLGESDQEFYNRVSERLRHKSRAINNWDYERMVLEEFSSVFKVKCINNYLNGHFSVGHVTIVPIADLRNRDYAGNDLQTPKLNYIDLRRIESFLSTRSSPFAKIHAVNPQIEYVFIACKVKFRSGIDKGFHIQKLNEDIKSYLTPWANGDWDAVSFSAKVYASSIINFIDKLPYVDYVVDLVMQQYVVTEKGEHEYIRNPDMLKSLVETQLTTGHSILVSAPRHEIELVE